MSIEIERKFLVPMLPNMKGIFGKDILQGYLSTSNSNMEKRVRKKGNKFYFTEKFGKGLKRKEQEREISEFEFNAQYALTQGRRVEKTRYEIPFKEKIIELDVYSGNLEGLIVAEIEFDSINESKDFLIPEWFGREVTSDERYKNKNLALYGLPED